jgi:surface protein
MAVGSFRVPAGGGASTEDWVRPSDWLAMPTVTSAEQKFVGLHAIFPEGNNFVAFRFTTSTGQYQVDWGDGSSPTLHNSNTTAEYAYDYATYDVGDTTLSSRGYKQAIITVTPVSGNLLTANFQQRYTGQNQPYATGFLDCIISMPNHSASGFAFGGLNVKHSYVERFDVKTLGSCNSLASMFRECYSLQSVPLFNTAAVTNMSSMFIFCYSLKSVPLFNTTAVTNMSSMFNGCNSLQSVPLFNTTAVTNMSSMFNGCNSLQSVPLFNTAAVTNMSSMFVQCFSLQSVPLFNTAAVTNMSSMFVQCFSLQSVPLFNTAAVTNMLAMFQSCSSLQSVPLFNTAAVTSMGSMFVQCFSLQSVPLFNTAAVTSMAGMFSFCNSLQSVPALSTASITTTSGTDFAANFANATNSLDRCQMVFARTVGFANCQLSATALDEIFTNLIDRSATTQASITITGNYGAATANTAIATAKNWQVIN